MTTRVNEGVVESILRDSNTCEEYPAELTPVRQLGKHFRHNSCAR